MRKLTETLYELEEGVYAEQRAALWFITDEDEAVLDGPFDTLALLQEARTEAADLSSIPSGLQVVTNRTSEAEVTVTQAEAEDLVTLREAAAPLGVTRQALEARKRRGTLGVEPAVTGRSVELYSLKALRKELGR